MKKKTIRYSILLFVIPAIVCIIIAITSGTNKEVDSTLSLDNAKQNTITTVQPTTDDNTFTTILNTVKKHDTTIVFSVIGIILLSMAFYLYVKLPQVDREKEETKERLKDEKKKKKDTE